MMLLTILCGSCIPSRRHALAPTVWTARDVPALDSLTEMVFSQADYLMTCAARHFDLYPLPGSPEQGHVFYSLNSGLLLKYMDQIDPDNRLHHIRLLSDKSSQFSVPFVDVLFRPADRAIVFEVERDTVESTIVRHLVLNYDRPDSAIETVHYRQPLGGQWTYVIVSYIDDEWQ